MKNRDVFHYWETSPLLNPSGTFRHGISSIDLNRSRRKSDEANRAVHSRHRPDFNRVWV
jgi:hypothetical protein